MKKNTNKSNNTTNATKNNTATMINIKCNDDQLKGLRLIAENLWGASIDGDVPETEFLNDLTQELPDVKDKLSSSDINLILREIVCKSIKFLRYKTSKEFWTNVETLWAEPKNKNLIKLVDKIEKSLNLDETYDDYVSTCATIVAIQAYIDMLDGNNKSTSDDVTNTVTDVVIDTNGNEIKVAAEDSTKYDETTKAAEEINNDSKSLIKSLLITDEIQELIDCGYVDRDDRDFNVLLAIFNKIKELELLKTDKTIMSVEIVKFLSDNKIDSANITRLLVKFKSICDRVNNNHNQKPVETTTVIINDDKESENNTEDLSYLEDINLCDTPEKLAAFRQRLHDKLVKIEEDHCKRHMEKYSEVY